MPSDPLLAARSLTRAEVAELLTVAAEAAGAELAAPRLRSVHHRPGRSYSEVHEAVLRVGDVERDVLLVTHVDVRHLPAEVLQLERGGVRVGVWRFPYDPYLPGLAPAVHTGRVRELLDAVGGPSGTVSLRTRAYRPTRRGVVEVGVEGADRTGRVLYLKVLAGRRAEQVAELHRALRPVIPVPRVIGVSARQGILAMEALGGVTLNQALSSGAPVPAPEALVELSLRLAEARLPAHRDPTAFADPRRHVTALAELIPERAEQVERVAALAASPGGTTTTVHGDLHGGQLLIDPAGDVGGVLDVDGAGTGLLAHDAGSLVAHLAALAELQPPASQRIGDYAARLTQAYRAAVDPDALARATAGAWLGLATGPFRAQEPDWHRRTRARIDAAQRALDGQLPG